MNPRLRLPGRLLPLLLWAALAPAGAASGKLLLTDGVGSIDGAAGGGLVPWALTASLAARGEVGATATLTTARTADYGLNVAAMAVTVDDRFEISIAEQDLDAGDKLAALGLRRLHLRQRIAAIKWRLAGDAVLDSDRLAPQWALGLQHRRADAGALAPTLHGVLGARRADVEATVSATKLLLAQGLLVNATLRLTRANQVGLLGFGAAGDARRRLEPELSLAWLPARGVAVGAEWRRKGDRLRRSALGDGALAEGDWFDVFVVWAPVKALSITVAWVDLGPIAPAATPRRQRGGYLSAQLSI